MKKRWLRGAWLGVSLALLLAGVALAGSAQVDRGCFECIPLDHMGDIPYDPYLFTVSGSDWSPSFSEVDVDFYFPGGTTRST